MYKNLIEFVFIQVSSNKIPLRQLNYITVCEKNALNEISNKLSIYPMSYSNHFIDEVDNKDDLARVNACIEQWDFKKQSIKQTHEYLISLKSILKRRGL